MVKRLILTSFLLLLALIYSGCATPDGTPVFTTRLGGYEELLPAMYNNYSVYKPRPLASEEEALSIIRSSMGYVVYRNQKPYDITADRYSAIFKIQWTEYNTTYETTPTVGGFFWGWDYIPTYSETTTAYHSSEQKNDSLTIQFRDITGLYFYNRTTLVIMGQGGNSYLSCGSGGSLATLADAIYTMAIKNGSRIEEPLFNSQKLSREQCEMLKIEGGDFLTAVFAGSEAEAAGLKSGDVILNLDEVTAAKGFDNFFAAKKYLKVLRWSITGSTLKYKNLRISMKGGK